MKPLNTVKSKLLGPVEYKWVPVLYISYFLTLVGWLTLVPADENLTMQVVILMTLVYVAALTGTIVRALQRIEERLEQL